jgi:hypothetical protein
MNVNEQETQAVGGQISRLTYRSRRVGRNHRSHVTE